MVGKNILIVVGANHVSGTEIANLNLIRDFHNWGHNVLVIVSGWSNGDFINRLSELGVRNMQIKLGFIYISKPLWTLDTLINYPAAIFKLNSVLNSFKPQCIIHSSYRNLLMGYPVFSRYKNIYWEHANQPITNRTINLFKFLDKKISKFVCPSYALKENLQALNVNGEKISVIPSPIDPIFENLVFLKNDNSIPRIGIVGQIIPGKGFEFIFDVLDKLNLDFELHIYGDHNNDFAKNLMNKLSNNMLGKTHWLGFVKDRISIFSNLDIVLFPSLSETFGRIVIEAGASKIPIITSDLPCFKENVVHGETGYIFELDNPYEINKYIKILINDSSFREKMGEKAREHVLGKYKSSDCSNKFLSVLTD